MPYRKKRKFRELNKIASNGKMFAIAVSQFGDDSSLWQIEEDGIAKEFAITTLTHLSDLAFGLDGAMYVGEYDDVAEA